MGFLRRKTLVILLSLLAPPTALSQPRNTVSVSGMVVTEGGNQRIQHVTVQLCDSGGTMLEQFVTSDSGEFSFRGLQRVPYILTFDAVGFEKSEMHLDLSFMSDRGMTIYLRPTGKETKPTSAGNAGRAVSAHELSMPESARDLVGSGKKKLYVDKNPEAGLKDFQQAVSIEPGYYEAYCQIGMAYATLGKTDEAKNSFRRAIEASHDKYGEAEVGLGTLLLETGDTAGGEQAVRRGVQLSPGYWMGFYELGKLDLNRNKLGPALQSAEQAKLVAPNVPIVYRLLTKIHMRQGNYVAVLEDLDAYIKLDPDSPTGLRAKEMREEIRQKLGQHF